MTHPTAVTLFAAAVALFAKKKNASRRFRHNPTYRISRTIEIEKKRQFWGVGPS